MSSRTASSRRAPAKRRKSSRSSSAGQGVTQWIVILALVAGGIALYDNRQTVMKQVAPLLKDDRPSVARTERKAEPRPEKSAAPVGVAKAPVPPVAVGEAKAPVPDAKPAAASASAGAGTALMGEDFKGRFYFCGTSGLDNCVADGDTFWFSKTRITLADISAPATDKAACQQERDRGFAAKVRLRDLLNAGKFDIEVLKGQPLQAGSSVMRVVTRDGRSLGSILVSEGLAKPRLAANQSWCP
ncbi:thermonuclease family protein [Rhizobium wuzhouense]|uniref:Nuclease n=1 Tax=Rhizobium wuzhouense TaxID=1986026 RepID=A0ABX5NSI5_9HYPH|nr:nuclease [Rhizobium wuzhouense]PYB71251.1 nuclease [Rhizobium wuzhouense]